MSAGDEMRRELVKLEAMTKEVFVNVATEAHRSVVEGSELTGSPGQPIDTGYLRASWLLSFGELPTFTLSGEGPKKDPAWSGGASVPSAPTAASLNATQAFIATNAAYAEVIEDGLVSLKHRKGDAGVSASGSKRRISLRPNTRIDTGAQIGGHHSVKITVAGMQRVVDTMVQRTVKGGGA